MNNKMVFRVLSMILSTIMIVTLSMVSVAAIPADYTVVENKHYVHDFTSGGTTGFSGENNGTGVALSSTMGHGDTSSLEITAGSQNFARFYITWDNIADFDIEANSNYYLSFWYYAETDGWGGTIANGTMEAPYSGAMPSYSFSSKTKGQWNKVVTTMTSGSNTSNKWMRFCAWSAPQGTKIYFDDFEIAKISSTTGLINTVPEGATSAKTAILYGENATLTKHMLVNGTNSGDTVALSADYAHWSDMSYKFVSAQASSLTGTYINTRESMFLGYSSNSKLKANTPYYISYYVFCPTKDVKTSFIYLSGESIIGATTVPQGEWTKVSALFTPTEAQANQSNGHLLKLQISDTALDGVNQPVYLDDFVLAELSTVLDTVITPDAVDYDFDTDVANVTFTSPVGITSAIDTESITAPEGVVVESVSEWVDGNTVTVNLSNVEDSSAITLTFKNVTDVFGRTADIQATFTTPSPYTFDTVIETVDGTNATYTREITKSSNGSKNLAMIVATYNTEGEMISAGMDINSVAGGGDTVPFSVTITKGASFRVLVFDWSTFNLLDEWR